MKTAQVKLSTLKVFAVVMPELKNFSPPSGVVFVNVADEIDVEPGDIYNPKTNSFSRP